jgi:hypothetical protein
MNNCKMGSRETWMMWESGTRSLVRSGARCTYDI